MCADICFGSGDTSDPVLTGSQLKSEKGSIVFEQQENGLSFSVEYKKGVTEDAIVYEAPGGKSYRMAFKLGLPVLVLGRALDVLHQLVRGVSGGHHGAEL